MTEERERGMTCPVCGRMFTVEYGGEEICTFCEYRLEEEE